MAYRRWLDSVTSCVVWFRPRDDANDNDEDRYTVVFYGKYYTHHDPNTGFEKHLCICCDCAGDRWFWEDYDLEEVGNRDCLGERVAWGRLPTGITTLVESEYRRGIPNYRARPVSTCPHKYRENYRNYFFGK